MKRLFVSIVAALVALSATAQSTIGVEVHNIVELGERFNLVFVMEGDEEPSDFTWEAGDDFTVVWGPQKGTSRSVQIINGKTTRSSQTSYTYILQARQAGNFTIQPAQARVKGNTIHSKPVTIQVVNGGQQNQPSSQQSPQEQSQNSGASTAEQDIFMRLTLSRSSVVVGEPVIATLKIFKRAHLMGFENARFPSFQGFWSQEDVPANIEFQREQVGGTMYDSAVLRKWVLIPQKSGDQTIEPAEVVCLVNVQRRRSSSGSIFDDFFNNDYATVRQRVSTKPITLHVGALPSGAPASFGGGVGEFSIQARLSKDSLKTHDAASLLITISGKGNIALLEAPKVNFPPDFEVYDVKTSVNTDKSSTSGSKTFEYPFIPRSAGEFSVGPVEYAYYDVAKRRYSVAAAAALPLKVERSASDTITGSPDAGTTLMVDRKGVKNLGEDIRFIRTKTMLEASSGFLVYSKAWWGTVLFLLVAGLGFWLGFRKAAARRADVVGTRNRKATRQALKRLAQARDFLQKNLYTAFYEELHRSLLGFVGDKLTMDMADMSKENIEAALASRGVPQEVAAGFTALLNACEEARYAPDAGHEAMNDHYEKAVSTITAIDASMKKTSTPVGAALVALLILLPLGAQAQPLSYPDSLFKAGVEAYTQGSFSEALRDWQDVEATGLMSKELYYNLGNAYFKDGQIAPAVLWYERALRLDPSDQDVRYNLEYARALTQDKIEEVPEIFFVQWGHALCYLLPSNVWAVIGLVFLAVTVALVLLFLLGSTAGQRKTGFFTGIVALLIALLGWEFAQWQRQEALRQDLAIVMKPVVSVKSSPSAGSAKDLFILHEGTRVRILDNVAGYTQIEIADGRQGWIPSGEMEVI